MSDRLESMLDRLERVRTEPPAAFIHAVARRRHRRRMVQAGTMAMLGLVLAGAWLMLNPRPVTPPPPLAYNPPPPTSMLALRLVNARMDVDDLTLPEMGGAGGEVTLPLSARPERVEGWLSQ